MTRSSFPADVELPTLAPCIAGLRSAIADAKAAVEAWRDERLEPMARLLDDAAAALSRANRMATELTQMIPSHSRRARIVLRAVEQVTEALRVLERARVWDWSEETQEADDAMQAAMLRAIGTATRAVDAAGG